MEPRAFWDVTGVRRRLLTAEWGYVAHATRRRRRILWYRILCPSHGWTFIAFRKASSVDFCKSDKSWGICI
ncbi:MAG: hypothetical protein ACLR9K_07050, partial [Blautia sp.]